MASWRVVPAPRKRSKQPRTALIVGGSVVVIAILAFVLVKLATSGNDAKKPAKVENSAGLTLQLGDVAVESAGPPATISKSTQQSVLDSSQEYVDQAIMAPLEKGSLDRRYSELFDSGVRSDATGRDQATVTEVRTGKSTPVKATATKVRLDGLGDQTGKVVLVAATFGVDLDVKGAKIKRLTELTFADEHGKWVVTAYRVGVERARSARTTSVVAHAGTGVVS
jgi:hypothetical protein